jgi:hypothetical protein
VESNPNKKVVKNTLINACDIKAIFTGKKLHNFRESTKFYALIDDQA